MCLIASNVRDLISALAYPGSPCANLQVYAGGTDTVLQKKISRVYMIVLIV